MDVYLTFKNAQDHNMGMALPSGRIRVSKLDDADKTLEFIIRENLYRWVNWTIVQKTHDYQKEDARTVHFPVKVAAGAEASVRYTVNYSG